MKVFRTESLFAILHNSSPEYVPDLHVAEGSHLRFVKPDGDVDYTALFLPFKISASGRSSQERSDPGCWAFDCCVTTPV